MIGSGDEDAIITKVVSGTDPLQDFEVDDPMDLIIINYETDDTDDVDDLWKVSMASARGVSKEQLQGLLTDIAAAPQKVTSTVDTLVVCINNMMLEQAEEAAVMVTSKLGHV